MEGRQGSYVCPYCGFTCFSSTVLKTHLKGHGFKEEVNLKMNEYELEKHWKASLDVLTIFRDMTVHLTTVDGVEYIGVLTSIGKDTVILSTAYLKRNNELYKAGKLKIEKNRISHIGFYNGEVKIKADRNSFLHRIVNLFRSIFRS